MYKSPIEIIVQDTYQKLLEQREENIFKAILETGVKVDKEELLKALKYDREQYSKGYVDGAKEFAERLEERIAVHLLKNKSNEYADGFADALDGVNGEIDNLLKEMVGE